MAKTKLLANVKKVPSGPEAAFCTMLSTLYATKTALLNVPLKVPLAYIARIKGRIKRIEKVVAKAVDVEIKYLEDLVIKLFLIDEFNKNKQVSNFCVIAYNCSALVNHLAESPIVPEAQKEAIKTNYALFEQIVCKQGLNRIVSTFINEQAVWILAQVALLRDKLLDQLDIDTYIAAYAALINSYLPYPTQPYAILENMTVSQWLAVLADFSQCAFIGCDYSQSAENLLADWREKLSLDDLSFTELTANVTTLNEAFETRLDDIEEALNFRTENMNVDKDDVMKN